MGLWNLFYLMDGMDAPGIFTDFLEELHIGSADGCCVKAVPKKSDQSNQLFLVCFTFAYQTVRHLLVFMYNAPGIKGLLLCHVNNVEIVFSLNRFYEVLEPKTL